MGDKVLAWAERTLASGSARERSPISPAELKTLSDEQLMEHLKEGEHGALSCLFDRYHRLVLGLAAKVLRNATEAEDVMQEVFFELYRTAEKFDATKGSAKTWIIRFSYHRSLNRRRYLELRRFYERSQIAELDWVKGYAFPNGSCGLTADESARIIEQGLATLNPKQRETLELACFDGLSLSEIAARKRESLANVRHYYYRGIQKLRAILQESFSRGQDAHPRPGDAHG